MKNRMMCLLTVAVLAGSCAFAVSSKNRLQQALYSEQVEGDLPAAITYYQSIVDDAKASPDQVAQSLLRQSMCQIQLGQEAKAQVALTRLINDYADHTELVAKARPLLDSMRVFDPASIMPAEMLAYAELGSTGDQLATILEMLKGTPFEDPLKTLSQQNLSGPGMLMAGLLNPAMQEEFKNIGGMAVGLVDITPNIPSMVGVLDLGESSMLRGLLVTGLNMAGRVDSEILGVRTYRLMNGELVAAFDDSICLFSSSNLMLKNMIRKYKDVSSAPSLATGNSEFRKVGRSARHDNFATLWVNVDDLYGRFNRLGGNLSPVLGAVNMMSIDDLILQATLAADNIGVDARLCVKEGMNNLVYEMVKTPTINRAGLKGVPSDAVGLVSFDLAESGSMQMSQLRQFVLMNMGVELSAEMIDSIEQITLFALPYDLEPSPLSERTQASIQIANKIRLGILIQNSNSAPIVSFLQEMEPMLKQAGLSFLQLDGAVVLGQSSYVLDAVANTLGGASSVVDAGALHESVNEYADSVNKLMLLDLAAVASRSQVERKLPQQAQVTESVNKYSDAAEKLVLVELTAVARRSQVERKLPQQAQVTEAESRRVEAGYEALGNALEGATLSIQTDEKPHELVLQARLSGIPELGGVISAVQEISEATFSIRKQVRQLRAAEQKRARAEREAEEQRARAARFDKLVPAQVMQTATAPTIDGALDDMWSKAKVYPVQKKVKPIDSKKIPAPIAGNQCAADFRMMWDADNLYVYIDVTDSTLNRNPDIGWALSDCTLLHIDATDSKSARFGATDYSYAFCWDETAPSLKEKKKQRMANVTYKIITTDKGYSMEAAFPWATLKTPNPALGTMIGLDLQVHDNQTGKGRNQILGWNGTTTYVWQDPSLFGRAILTAGEE